MGKRAEAKKRQKRWRVYEFQIKPALEKIAVLKDIPGLHDPVRDHARAKLKKVDKLQARLVDPELKKEAKSILRNDTIAVRPPTAYYVILGRGAAAVVNHTTMRQSEAGRDRFGELPVMHIGMQDPWLHYHEHGMGQPPYLLRLPGYHHPVAMNAATIRTGLRSDLFAASTDAEMDLLRQKFETYVVEGWAAAMESRAIRVQVATRQALQTLGLDRNTIDARLDSAWPDSYPPYRLLMANTDAELFLVYAAKVDICSGGGAGRTTPREAWAIPGPLLTAAQTRPWNPSYQWTRGEENRAVIHGLDGLSEATAWADETRVCVYGAGGIGLNQLERAHDEHHVLGKTIWMDWYARDFLHEPTFNLRRNDTVLRDLPHRRFMDAGGADAVRTSATVYNTAFHIVPGSTYWRWAHHAKIRTVTEPGPRPLHVDLYLRADDVGVVANLVLQAEPWCEDFWEEVEQGSPARTFAVSAAYQFAHARYLQILDPGDYDRLILCLGQQQDLPGEPRKVADRFVFTPIVHDARMVGLQAEGGAVRVLGASAVMFPGAAGPDFTAMTNYRLSMAASAVPPGFILMGANIAAANGFFTDDEPNRNVNTASFEELIVLLEAEMDAMVAGHGATEIVAIRSFPNNGIPSMPQLRNELLGRWPNANTFDAFFDGVAKAVSMDYRTPDEWL